MIKRLMITQENTSLVQNPITDSSRIATLYQHKRYAYDRKIQDLNGATWYHVILKSGDAGWVQSDAIVDLDEMPELPENAEPKEKPKEKENAEPKEEAKEKTNPEKNSASLALPPKRIYITELTQPQQVIGALLAASIVSILGLQRVYIDGLGKPTTIALPMMSAIILTLFGCGTLLYLQAMAITFIIIGGILALFASFHTICDLICIYTKKAEKEYGLVISVFAFIFLFSFVVGLIIANTHKL